MLMEVFPHDRGEGDKSSGNGRHETKPHVCVR